MTIEDMIDSLKKGVVNITFKKIDSGEIRKMPSTLKSDLIPDGTKIQSISSNSDTIMVWSLDKNAWRDIRVDTISSWEVV
ncbi:MAG: SH3 beta-barrel fold-containing protein [Gammaproteobacteria bacterium]|tara:strand:+ start:2033 stop:2272 length:240 start_codon:yes stop_codon:yes gene_type:complete